VHEGVHYASLPLPMKVLCMVGAAFIARLCALLRCRLQLLRAQAFKQLGIFNSKRFDLGYHFLALANVVFRMKVFYIVM
jgi:hypothetical protein